MLVPKELILEAKQKYGEKATEDIKEYFNIENWDEKNLKGSCPFGHSDTTPSFIWNVKNNSFHCFSCGKNFGILDLYMLQGLTFLSSIEKLFSNTDIKFSFGERELKTERDYKYPHYTPDDNRDLVDAYCKSRKISKETLDYCGVKQSGGLLMWNFYNENDTLVTVKCRRSRKPEKTEQKEWYLSNFDNTPILYNMNKIDPTQPLIITEGQFDTLSVVEAGYKNVVSVPSGTENLKWIEVCFDWLNNFDKIILFFDNDLPGIKARKEAASRLGIYKTLFVELPTTLKNDAGKDVKVKDANEVLFHFGSEKIIELIDNAQEIPITGVEDLSSVDDFDIETAPGLYTGIEEIDKTIYKFLFGSVILFTGVRGSGKSTLINQFFICEPLEQGYDVFVFSGELSSPVLKSWVELSMAGPERVRMKGENIHIIDSSTKKEMREWYKNRIWVYSEVDNRSDKILEKAISVTRKYGAKVWIFDNLSTIDLETSSQDLLLKQKDFIAKLVKIAILYNVLIILVNHPNKLQPDAELRIDDIGGTGSLSNLSQYVMYVKRFSDKEKGGEKDTKGNWRRGKEPFDEDCEINIMKNRYTGTIKATKVFFNYPSYRFYLTASELYKRYKWNKDKSPIPTQLPEKTNVPDWAK